VADDDLSRKITKKLCRHCHHVWLSFPCGDSIELQ
jgi:hypothetical protein